jgi:hypothetical protein
MIVPYSYTKVFIYLMGTVIKLILECIYFPEPQPRTKIADGAPQRGGGEKYRIVPLGIFSTGIILKSKKFKGEINLEKGILR